MSSTTVYSAALSSETRWIKFYLSQLFHFWNFNFDNLPYVKQVYCAFWGHKAWSVFRSFQTKSSIDSKVFLNISRLCSDLWLQERWEWLNFCPPCLVVSFFIRTYHGWLWEAEPPVNLFQHFIGLFRALLVLRRRGLGRRRKNHAASVGEYYQVRTTGPPALPVQAWHSRWSTILLDGTPKNTSQWGKLRFCSYRFSLISKWLKTSRPYNRSS